MVYTAGTDGPALYGGSGWHRDPQVIIGLQVFPGCPGCGQCCLTAALNTCITS